MKLAALSLLLVCSVQAQQIVPLHSGHLLTEGGAVVDVDGGAWLPDSELIRLAKEKADQKARNDFLEAHSSDKSLGWIVAALAVGIVAGGVSGFVLAKLAK